MKVLFHLPNYFPTHCAGGESMAHNIAKGLQRLGNQIHVITFDGAPYLYDGIRVNAETKNNLYGWADVVFTHLGSTGEAWNRCRRPKLPLVHLLHNNYRSMISVKTENQYAVYNSDWIRDDYQLTVPGVVVNPPVKIEKYQVTPGEKYTLINCNKNKGGAFLPVLARHMPDKRFLGVKGGYGIHISESVPNLVYEENTPNVREIYSKTRILLMPSIYESWGQTAIEAFCSGIPVIASDTPGLKESLGDAGIFIKGRDPEEWKQAIEYVEKDYATISDKCLERAQELEKRTGKQLEYLNTFIHETSKSNAGFSRL